MVILQENMVQDFRSSFVPWDTHTQLCYKPFSLFLGNFDEISLAAGPHKQDMDRNVFFMNSDEMALGYWSGASVFRQGSYRRARTEPEPEPAHGPHALFRPCNNRNVTFSSGQTSSLTTTTISVKMMEKVHKFAKSMLLRSQTHLL